MVRIEFETVCAQLGLDLISLFAVAYPALVTDALLLASGCFILQGKWRAAARCNPGYAGQLSLWGCMCREWHYLSLSVILTVF